MSEQNGQSTALVTRAEESVAVSAFSGSTAAFESAQRMAAALSKSTLVPTDYQNDLPNCLIAIEMAHRTGASVFMVMQSLDVIHGRPSWRSQFLIASVNSCARFTPIEYHFVGERGKDSWGCYCTATDRRTGKELQGETITVGMAKTEGWYNRKGSKWPSLTGQMLRYRAAAFWTRVYCPEIALGMHTADEMEDAEVVSMTEHVRQVSEALRTVDVDPEEDDAQRPTPEEWASASDLAQLSRLANEAPLDVEQREAAESLIREGCPKSTFHEAKRRIERLIAQAEADEAAVDKETGELPLDDKRKDAPSAVGL